jgi:outer membrane protein OmpA-like peptidoglycan-associated protein/tetratricopeptide (TPR) repeat protein
MSDLRFTIYDLRFYISAFLLSVFSFLFSVNISFAQKNLCPHQEVKKAAKLLDDAKDIFKSKRDYKKTKELVDESIDADPEYVDAYYFLGTTAIKMKDDKTLEEAYLKVAELCPDLDAEVFYQLGWLYFDTKKFDDAIKYLKKYLEFDKLKEEHAAKADLMIFRSRIYKKPVPFNPEIVKGISTYDWEYLPYFSPDNDVAFFTRKFQAKDKGALFATYVEKFMMAKKAKGEFEEGEPMPYPFNRKPTGNEGAATITIDNNHLYFTVNDGGNFDIYSSDFENHKWTEIKNLGPNINDKRGWDAQPTISSDGKTLYFASARDSSVVTNIDIFYSQKNESGEWSMAKKLSSKINTNGREKSPFIHPDNKTLYFSSDSLPGLGGFDIFVCRKDSSGSWGTPVNIGYPINTDADEVGFVVSTDGRRAYFASDKLKGQGGYDIYSFNLYDEAQPGKVLFIKGELQDEDEKMPVPAKIELKNVKTNKTVDIDVDTVTGKYAKVVNFEDDYILTVKKQGYAFASEYFSSKDTAALKPMTVNLDIKKIETGAAYPLNDILFATNSAVINDTIKIVLDNFSEFLLDNPKVKVAIHGYTDNIGSAEDNLVLSTNRAKAVYEYLLSKEISKERLSYKGFGFANPAAPNTTREGRSRNRRTEFIITAK